MPNSPIDLADAIDALRAELQECVARSRSDQLQFELEPIELTLSTVVTRDKSGKIGWKVVELGAGREVVESQTLRLRLLPRQSGADDDDVFKIAADAD